MKTYLQEHKAEALKKIAEAVGEDWVVVCRGMTREYAYVTTGLKNVLFNPLTNAAQWEECLMWYRNTLLTKCSNPEDFVGASIIFTNSCDSRESLLIAILEVIDE